MPFTRPQKDEGVVKWVRLRIGCGSISDQCEADSCVRFSLVRVEGRFSMNYELRIGVEQLAVSSQEVLQGSIAFSPYRPLSIVLKICMRSSATIERLRISPVQSRPKMTS